VTRHAREEDPTMSSDRVPTGPRPGRRATIKDVAAAAGVALVTVSRVVNMPDRVQADTRDRVLKAMRELGYSPNLAARSMRTQFTRSIGFLTPQLASPTNAAVAQACERALAEAGYAMLVASSDYRPEREVAALELLRGRGVDGIVLYVSDESHAGLARALARTDVPLVVLDRTLRVATDRVLSEHTPAMTAAVQHLAGLGHQRIALVQHEQRVRPMLERRRALLDAAGALRLPDPRVLQLPRLLEPVLPDDLFKGPQAPTALLADGTRLLRAVLQGLRRFGLAVPQDRSVIGIDTEEASSLTTPETTTLVRDFAAVGRAAAELMLQRLGDRASPPQQRSLESRLVLAGSCAAPPRSNRR
jgi:LacI family transcriptional regulator